MSDVEHIISVIRENFGKLDEIISELKFELSAKREEIRKLDVKIDIDVLVEFLKEPYCILPKKKDHYWVVVPKFVDFYVGWLEHETRNYNIFVINRFTQWITELPEGIREKLKFEEKPSFKVFDGVLLTGKEHQDEAWRRYRDYLVKRIGDDRIKIKKAYEFQLIASLIEDGILPFVPRPVEEPDLRDWDKIELRDYQKEAWERFIETGAIGLFYPFGAGKSFFGLYALGRIKGRKLVVAPNLTLVEQWKQRIEEYMPEFKDEIDIYTYQSFHKVKDKNYVLTIFEEVHHLPAPSYIKLATIKTKYRIGLSGSPFREDGNESYIFALTGFPIGVNWKKFISKGIVSKPRFVLYLVKNKTAKVKKLEELLRIPVKTIIFCDSISFGEELSKKLQIPFVHGKVKKDRLDVIRASTHVIVSRVGDEGISIPEVERIIEVDYLAGSRMQESQRFGRLMHSKQREPQYIIIMTEDEFEKYEKQLYAITERGFRIEIVR